MPSTHRIPQCILAGLVTWFAMAVIPAHICAGTKTWDGRHDTRNIRVTAVYFVPRDRTPLPDWKARVEYHCRRLELFHHREFGDQSTLQVQVQQQPLISLQSTAELRQGDGDAIFFRTLRECDHRLQFGRPPAGPEKDSFPILLVLSEINWRPLDDFFRLRPDGEKLVFEGNYNRGEHFPGATSGGARATYLANPGKGWGLVSADGWRVPYRGTDCVVYHEGVGHTVGLPHPEPNGSVMSLGQYKGWLNESWLDKEQKLRLGWNPGKSKQAMTPQIELFSRFRALPNPKVPRPEQEVQLDLDWPDRTEVTSLRLRFQTGIDQPWIEVPQKWQGPAPNTLRLGKLERSTPVSYRIDGTVASGATFELWGYFQVRTAPEQPPQPHQRSLDLLRPRRVKDVAPNKALTPQDDLLQQLAAEDCWQTGAWSIAEKKLTSPKQFGARIELPYQPPVEYRAVYVVEALDPPNGLILGQRSGTQRFVTLLNYARGDAAASALENVDGANIGNPTTAPGHLFVQNRLSQVIVTVTKAGVDVSVDGRQIITWRGNPQRLALGEYWSTPNSNALFVGCYDCRYRFHRITIEPLTGKGETIKRAKQADGDN